jgi:hypothetical protein
MVLANNGDVIKTFLYGRYNGRRATDRVKARAIYPNCARCIPKMKLVEPIYALRDGHRSIGAHLEELTFAPWPWCGSIACAASPSSTVRPRDQGHDVLPASLCGTPKRPKGP